MNTYYYSRVNWNTTIALLNAFNDITIYRYATSGTNLGAIVNTIDVPIVFGPIEKTQAAREVDHPSDTTRYYQSVPKMALVPKGLTHDSDRAYSSQEARFWNSEDQQIVLNESVYKDFQPTPYNYDFTLYIRCDMMEDVSQILENILPYFNPKYELRVREFSFLNVERDLPVELKNVNFDFSEVLDSETMRTVNVELDLTVEGWMYKPVTSATMVKIINMGLYVGDSAGFDTSGNPVTGTNLYTLDSTTQWEGYNATSAMPTSGYNTSGYNVDTDVYWIERRLIE
jgi:hypothetical protein